VDRSGLCLRLRFDMVSDSLSENAYHFDLHLLSPGPRRCDDRVAHERIFAVNKLLAAGVFLLAACRTTPIDWTAYGHDAAGTRHSPAAQVTRENVGKLEVAWIYRTGDYGVGEGAARSETTPLMIDGTLYLSSPFGRVMALDPDTGKERWNYDPRVDLSGEYGD